MPDDSPEFPGSAAPEPPAKIALVDWRPLRQNTLCGFATVRITPGVVIHDLPIHTGGAGAYALWPGKPQIDRSGRVLTDENGRRRYTPVVEIPDPGLRERLSSAIVELVRRRDPGSLE